MSYRPLLLFFSVKYGYFTKKAEITFFAYWITEQFCLIMPILITFLKKHPILKYFHLFSLNGKLPCAFSSSVQEQNQLQYFLNQYSVGYLNENAKQ